MDRWTNGEQKDEWMNVRIDERMDVQTDRWTDGWMKGQMGVK